MWMVSTIVWEGGGGGERGQVGGIKNPLKTAP